MARMLAPVTGSVLVALTVATTPLAAAQPDAIQYVRTESGTVRCVIEVAEAVCERTSADGFPGAPLSQLGGRFNLAGVDAGGAFRWNEGNIGAGIDQDVVLAYGKTYRFNGWTVVSTFDGTRLTNDASGHGMFVAVDGVSSF